MPKFLRKLTCMSFRPKGGIWLLSNSKFTAITKFLAYTRNDQISFHSKIVKTTVIALLFILLISITAPALHACPGCGAALNGEISHGFNLSVLYMMAMPFLVFGGVAIGIVYVTRQNRTKANTSQISTVKKEEEN